MSSGDVALFFSHDFGLPSIGLSSSVHSGSLDSLHSSPGTSSSSAWALGLGWNGPKPLGPSSPTILFLLRTNKIFFDKNRENKIEMSKMQKYHDFGLIVKIFHGFQLFLIIF